MQFVLTLLLFAILCVVGFEDKFAGRLSYDDIVYTSIDVPQATKTLNLGLWAQGFGTEQVKVLLGKGRIPTIDDYDELLDIPSLSQSLQLLQPSPPSGKIFVGFWGGKMLSSYRYFAGQRPTSGAGIQYSLVSDEEDDGATTATVIGDGFVERTSRLTINSARSDVVIVLPDRQALQVNFSASMMNSSCPMAKPAGDILFVLEAYYDIAAHAETSSPKFVTAVQRVVKARLCDAQFMASLAPLVLNIPFPIAGRWTIVSSVLEVDPYASDHRPASATDRNRPVLRVVDYDPLFQHDDTIINRGAPPVAAAAAAAAQQRTAAFDDRSVLSGRLRWTAPARQPAARSMNVFSLSTTHQEYIGPSANVFPRSSANSPDSSSRSDAEGRWIASPIVVAEVPSSPGHLTANLFGGVVVQLFLRVNSHSEYFLSLVEALPWIMALRIGNAPYATFDADGAPQWVADATLFTVGVPPTADTVAEGGFPPPHGGTRPMTSVSQRASYPSKSNARQHVLRFDWFWPRPRLDHFHTRGDIADSSRRIYFRTGLQYPSGTAYDRVVASIVQELEDNAITVDVQMKLVADPCEALGPRPCAHGGTCVASSAGTLGLSSFSASSSASSYIAAAGSLGDAVVSAQCLCRYPWAGAACRDLAVPSDVYAWQVIVLVVTNAAMWPAIALSLQHELHLITVGLSASSLSSAVYHLCDTEVFCLAGVSFEAWHVLDVLFSVAMIATVVLFLAPISRSLHAACSVAVLSVILAPVIDDPTNAAVLALTVVVSIAATLLLWAAHLRRLAPLTTMLSSSSLSSSSSSVVVDGGPSYASVPMFADESTRSEDTDDAATTTTTTTTSSDDRGDIEMETLSSGRGSGSGSVNPLHRAAVDGGSDLPPATATMTATTAARRRPETAPLSVTALLHESLDLVIAAGIGTLGLSSYALDNRTNYWYVHSLWHMCMMTAAFFLLRGRMRIFKRFAIDDR